MRVRKLYLLPVIIVGGILAGNGIVRLSWNLISQYKLAHAEHSEPVRVKKALIWRDPGAVAKLQFNYGQGGPISVPLPPFRFLQENMKGSSPSVFVMDSKGRHWRVKWGEEVRSETFANRLVWATGYFAETDYFINQGRILNAAKLQRASGSIQPDGNFHDARFELDEVDVTKHFDEESWAWNENPFVGSRELAGLRILMMFTSNWDNKDKRDVSRGSNTAVFFQPITPKALEAHYLFSDWGASMGKWGENILSRSKWDAQGFFNQTPEFVIGVTNGLITWGYQGQRTEDITTGVRVEDVKWFYQYVGKLSDLQLKKGLQSCGATEKEISLFLPALRDRINQLGQIAEGKTHPVSTLK